MRDMVIFLRRPYTHQAEAPLNPKPDMNSALNGLRMRGPGAQSRSWVLLNSFICRVE